VLGKKLLTEEHVALGRRTLACRGLRFGIVSSVGSARHSEQNDGSKDGSWAAIEALVKTDPVRVRGIRFAYNCGESAASTGVLSQRARRYP